ncbi:hypothetical protein NDI47_22250 [Microcoleus vaginatus GB1-A2]|uniref:AbiU2 domain-containing protein n=1 Tax=Microcoleus vaginatus TaxID=119532 RepID=UPI001684B7C4|nr:hypothetical protein [Microcoleus sp. FACHB-61]
MTVEKEEFSDMIHSIDARLSNAQYYLSVAYDLFYGLGSTPEKYAKARHFWTMTAQGFRNLCVLYLCQVYDSHDDAVSVPKILNIVESNYKSWKKTSQEIGELDRKQLEKDKIKFKDKKADDKDYDQNLDGLKKILFNHRDKAIAHYDKAELFKYKKYLVVREKNRKILKNEEDENAVLGTKPEEMIRPEKDDLQKLIDEARAICHRYMSLLKIEISPLEITEDYNNLLDISTTLE